LCGVDTVTPYQANALIEFAKIASEKLVFKDLCGNRPEPSAGFLILFHSGARLEVVIACLSESGVLLGLSLRLQSSLCGGVLE
jgi:hypothetical protein